MAKQRPPDEGDDDATGERAVTAPRPGREKDMTLRDRQMRATRQLPAIERGDLVLRSSRGHAWLEAPGGTENHVLLPRWAQVVPGDLVSVDKQGRIVGQVSRRSVLKRQAGIKGEQIFAANVDQAAVVIGPALLLREGFLGRALCGIMADSIHPILVFQKVDLDEDGAMRERARIYKKLKFEVHLTSANTGEGVAELRARFENKTSALLGQSGVGKSSLVNAMYPGVDLKVGEVDAWGRGKHTTTLARALRVPGGILIDLPGVREFGLVELDVKTVALAFPEIAKLSPGCHYPDCKHTGEERCAVEVAVDKGKLDVERWNAYQTIRASFDAGDEGGGRG